MTNAEKLAKNTELITNLLLSCPWKCDYCNLTCLSEICIKSDCKKEIQQWLEKEVKEDAKVH